MVFGLLNILWQIYNLFIKAQKNWKNGLSFSKKLTDFTIR